MLDEWLSAARFKPSPEQRVQCRATDSLGPYELPFPIRYRNGRWYNAQDGSVIEAFIVAWRQARKPIFAAPVRPKAAQKPSRFRSVFTASPEGRELFEKLKN